jgi:superoxide dismutase, Cu-Zn family
MRKSILIVLALVLIFVTYFVTQRGHAAPDKIRIIKGIAVIKPTKGNSVSGLVTFEETDKGVHVRAGLTGLTPGKHGFHIHEFGNISSDNGSSAGGHFNPGMMPHNMSSSPKKHAGDMGNIEADQSGNARLDYTDPVMKLNGNFSIIGRAVIVHEKEDDLKTQPTGNSGDRIAQGVIGIAK